MRSRKELIAIYDGLISMASRNIDGQVRVEWGTYRPTNRGLDRMISRRNKLMKGE
tara:strand:+ start:284 stop:448 length:165 start_codon:yes stop_codon:yes gene_type:complete